MPPRLYLPSSPGPKLVKVTFTGRVSEIELYWSARFVVRLIESLRAAALSMSAFLSRAFCVALARLPTSRERALSARWWLA